MHRLSLTQQFALRSLLFVVIMGAVLGITITFAVRTMFEQQAARVAHVTASAIVSEHLRNSGGTLSVTASMRNSLNDSVIHELNDSGIVAVKLWSPSGELLYSSSKSEEGESFADHEPLGAALKGRLTTEISEGEGDAENSDEVARFGKVLEVYAPIRDDRGQVRGVFEIYQLYGPVEAATNQLVGIVWLIIALGSIPAYLLQIVFVYRTEKQLVSAHSDLAEVNTRLANSLDDLEMHSLGTLQALVAAVDAKDSYTARHSIAVTDYAVAIARQLGLEECEIRDVERAGLLHDVGKIGTPETILLKPSRLDEEEFTVMCEHSAMGGHIVESVPFLSRLMPIIRSHHERYDGNGYPDHLAGDQIPLLSRILSVADAFDAMTSERPYRTPVPVTEARQELLRNVGGQFDATAVWALLEALDSGAVTVTIHAEAHRRRRSGAA